jgi:hypothetical protein
VDGLAFPFDSNLAEHLAKCLARSIAIGFEAS